MIKRVSLEDPEFAPGRKRVRAWEDTCGGGNYQGMCGACAHLLARRVAAYIPIFSEGRNRVAKTSRSPSSLCWHSVPQTPPCHSSRRLPWQPSLRSTAMFGDDLLSGRWSFKVDRWIGGSVEVQRGTQQQVKIISSQSCGGIRILVKFVAVGIPRSYLGIPRRSCTCP